jgi:hypothetical protein
METAKNAELTSPAKYQANDSSTVNYKNPAIVLISSLHLVTNSEHHWFIIVCNPGLFRLVFTVQVRHELEYATAFIILQSSFILIG